MADPPRGPSNDAHGCRDSRTLEYNGPWAIYNLNGQAPQPSDAVTDRHATEVLKGQHVALQERFLGLGGERDSPHY